MQVSRQVISGSEPFGLITVPQRLITPTAIVRGFFNVKRYHAPTNTVREELEWENLITNAGLDLMGTTGTSTALGYLGVGTGTNNPTNGDTALQTPAGTRVNREGTGTAYAGAAPYYNEMTNTYRVLEGNATGTLAEIGIFDASSNGNMFSRQRFKDGGGVNTTLTKLADEQLLVTYKFRYYSPTWNSSADDLLGTVTLDGIVYNYTMRPYRVHANWSSANLGRWDLTRDAYMYTAGSLVAPNASSGTGGTGSQRSSGTPAAYVNGTYYRDVEYIWEPSSGAASVNWFNLETTFASFQCLFSPVVPKTNAKRLKLTVRYSWARRP